MPANRNDITRKPIMTDTTRRESWRFYNNMGKVLVVWADTYEEARIHAKEQGWSLVNDYKEAKDEDDT